MKAIMAKKDTFRISSLFVTVSIFLFSFQQLLFGWSLHRRFNLAPQFVAHKDQTLAASSSSEFFIVDGVKFPHSFHKYMAKNPDELSVYDALGIEGILELEDPVGGRHFKCLKKYFDKWSAEVGRPQNDYTSTEAFFEWLDYSQIPTDLDSEGCSRHKLDHKRVFKFGLTDREKDVVKTVVNEDTGTLRLLYSATGKPLNSGVYIFVWGLDKRLYVDRAKPAESSITIGHTSFFGGRPVLHGGEVGVGPGGIVRSITAQSGHYRPGLANLRRFFLWIRDTVGVKNAATNITWKQTSRIKSLIFTDAEFSAVFK